MRAGVDFVVIGGVAVVIQATPRFTRDLDISYATDTANLERLGALLISLNARLRGVEDEVPFTPDAHTLRHTEMLTLTTRDGDLDLLAHPPGSPGYASLRRNADVVELDGCSARVASREDLIGMKRAAGRPQDEIDIEALEIARSRIRGKRRKPETYSRVAAPTASSVAPVSKHVLVLGAGFGGLELATRLSETSAEAVRVTLIDRNDSFFFGFSKLDVMLGRKSADEIRLHYRDFQKDGVEFRQETVTAIDPAARHVTTDAGSYDADFVVVALGADYDFAATPGFEQGGHEYYSLAGAEQLRDALADFKGGKVLVSILGQPFKCPPAPFEGSFLLHEHFTQQGIRDSVEMTTTFPMARPVPVTGEVAQMFRDGLAARNVEELPEHLVVGIDPAARTAQLANGDTLPYDLFVGIPIHRAPTVLSDAGLAVNNWVPVDQSNLRTRFPGVYALGDVCTGPRNVPKAGIFAEAAARVVADDIAATIAGAEPPAPYEGSGVCYAEFGGGLVSKVEVNFLHGDAPAAQRYDPSLEYAAEKDEFGRVRRERWFGRP